MSRHLRLLLVLPLLLAFAPAPKPKGDAKALQGTWKIVRTEEGGRSLTEDGWFEVTTVVVKGGRLEFRERTRSGEIVTAYAIALGPKKMELTLSALSREVDSPYYPSTLPGIYQLEKDTLTICYSTGPRGVRPTEFKTAPYGSEHLFVFQRVKP